jgi:hypothetical protein
VLATMTSQALLVVLAPTIAATGREIGATVAAVGQARTVTAAVAIAVPVPITARIGALGVPRLLVTGSVLTDWWSWRWRVRSRVDGAGRAGVRPGRGAGLR